MRPAEKAVLIYEVLMILILVGIEPHYGDKIPLTSRKEHRMLPVKRRVILRRTPITKPIPPSDDQVKSLTSRNGHRVQRVVNVQATFTNSERAKLAEDARNLGTSLSTLCRERVIAFPPIDSWAERASDIMQMWEDNPEEIKKAEKFDKERERRAVRISIRLTAYESTLLRWRAYCLHLSLSDYIRKMVLELGPGEGEEHISKVSRSKSPNDLLNFYNSVISIANDGRFPPNVSGFYCKSCAAELKMEDRR